MLEVSGVRVCYGGKKALGPLSFSLESGEWLMIVGPNGAGKSTLLGALSQTLPYTGQIRFDGADLSSLRPRALAAKIGMLSQSHAVGYAFTVGEIVRLGCYRHRAGVLSPAGGDIEARTAAALRQTGMRALERRSALSLSGGELQRAFLAQLFAQDPALMLLDEPTSHLDLLYQKQIFELVRSWLEKTGRTVISVVHDLSLARAYGTRALLLQHGETVCFGKPAQVFSPENLRAVYGMDVYAYHREMLALWE